MPDLPVAVKFSYFICDSDGVKHNFQSELRVFLDIKYISRIANW